MPLFLDHFDLVAHLKRQSDWSLRTYGPGDRIAGISDHIRKELLEVAAAHNPKYSPDLEALKEWIDVIILGLDGAWRTGAAPEMIAGAISAKQLINEERRWPDWRKAEAGKAIEHDRTLDPGALVTFLGQAQAFTVKLVGRRSLADGFEAYVELEELPGEFAPHLFKRVEA
jgi:hypothetical protein